MPFLTAIFDLIGVKGLIILAMSGIIWWQHADITGKQDTINEQASSLKTFEDRIREQNDSIDKANSVVETVQGKLNQAEINNEKISKDYHILKDKFRNLPLAKDCPSAVFELRNSQLDMVTKWNH